MPLVKYNESNKRRKILEPREYEVTIDSADIRTTMNGNEMLVLNLKPTDEDVVIYDRIVFSPKTQWKVRQFLDCFDLGPDTDDENAEINIDDAFVDNLIGLTGSVRIQVGTYNGIKRNEISAYIQSDDNEEEDDE
jgi:hypothetical protein